MSTPSDTCQFCASAKRRSDDPTSDDLEFECGTFDEGTLSEIKWRRDYPCYEREIAALRAMLAAQCEARTNSLGETCWFYPNDDRQYKSSAEAIQAELEIWMQKPLTDKEV